MKTTTRRITERLGALAVVAALLGVAAPAAAQEARSPEEIQALMERSLELGQPGPEHDRLTELAGDWQIELTLWPAPGADPVVTRSTGTAEVILGGRYVVMKQVIPDGDFAGESHAILGFDRRSGEYTMIGLDTIGTYWVTAQGPMTEDGVAVLSGTDFDPVFDADQEYDFVLHWKDDGSFVTELYFTSPMHTGGADRFKMLETVARRR